MEDEAHLVTGGLTRIVKKEDNLHDIYVFEVDLQHPATDEFTAVAVELLVFWGRKTLFKTV